MICYAYDIKTSPLLLNILAVDVRYALLQLDKQALLRQFPDRRDHRHLTDSLNWLSVNRYYADRNDPNV